MKKRKLSIQNECKPDEAVETTKDNNNVKEIQGDLFLCHGDSKTVSLAHCISSDAKMGKGIAVLFRQKFGRAEFIRSQKTASGGLVVLNPPSLTVHNKENKENSNRFIYYLVTKQRYFQKPTYETLRSSLLVMKEHAVEHKVTHIAMPRLGCGLDGLNWSKVYQMIKEIFDSTAVQISIYYL